MHIPAACKDPDIHQLDLTGDSTPLTAQTVGLLNYIE